MYKLQAHMTLVRWEDPNKLHHFEKTAGAGYPIASYIGGVRKLRKSLQRRPTLQLPRTKGPEAVAAAALQGEAAGAGKVGPRREALRRGKPHAAHRVLRQRQQQPL